MPSSPPDNEQKTAWTAAAALIAEPLLSVERQRGGRNNRLFCVTTARGTRYALKEYPRNDARDRLAVEFEALEHFSRCGLREVPRALGVNRASGFALYEWIEGSPISVPNAGDIDAALHLLSRLQDHRRAAGSLTLPLASEACLSGMDIMTQVERRLDRLLDVAASEQDLRIFLEDQFLPLWRSLAGWSRDRYQEQGMDFAAPLAVEYRALSPSDFGFHNAIRQPDGRIVFVDFEYFGWDDPVKLVSDFLQHPGMTLSPDLRTRFHRGAVKIFDGDKTFPARLRLLYPLFGLRWCTILLNEYLPERWQSRVFADANLDRRTATRGQLEKARSCLSNVRLYWMGQGASCDWQK